MGLNNIMSITSLSQKAKSFLVVGSLVTLLCLSGVLFVALSPAVDAESQEVRDETNFEVTTVGHHIVVEETLSEEYDKEDFSVVLVYDGVRYQAQSSSSVVDGRVGAFREYTSSANSPRYVIPVNLRRVPVGDDVTVEVIHDETDTVVAKDTVQPSQYTMDVTTHREGTGEDRVASGVIGSKQADSVTTVIVRTEDGEEIVAPVGVKSTNQRTTKQTYSSVREEQVASDGILTKNYAYDDDSEVPVGYVELWFGNTNGEPEPLVLESLEEEGTE